MTTVSRVFVIIGLALGALGGLSSVAVLVFGDSLLETMRNNESAFSGGAAVYENALAQATAKTLANILRISGRLALILVGGVLGLLACAADTSVRWKTIFSIVVIAAGIGLLAMRAWVPAGAYLIGGIVALLSSTQAPEAKSDDRGP